MPHVPGDPTAGHNVITSEPDDGGFFFQPPPGQLIANFIPHGTLINQSGICGPDVLGKYRSAPFGWFETTGYGEKFRPDDSQIERVFEGPWGYRPNFIAWALGFNYSVPHPQNPLRGILRREIPFMDCEFPWLYAVDYELMDTLGAWINMYIQATDCDGIPILIDNRPVYFPKIGYIAKDNTRATLTAKVKLIFRALDYEVRTDLATDLLGGGELNRYVTRDRTYSMEAIPLNSKSGVTIRFIEGPVGVLGREIPENSGRLLFPRQQLRYTWHGVPDEPVDIIEACIGKVNSIPFDGRRGARTYAEKTLLCLPPQNVRYRCPTGRINWRITHLLLHQPQGWDKFPASDGKFYRVDREIFETADLNQLFTVPAPVAYQ